MTYNAANPIISISNVNRKRQIADGAEKEKTTVIPNGIDLKRFRSIRESRNRHPPPIIGLIGRVVPIKDIKTFIRSISIICKYIPDAKGWIIGPDDEDPEYAGECRSLVVNMELEHKVSFLGFQRMEEMLPQLGILVLTSISEGQPLVILEAFASGLPVIATDVGFCRGLIEGDSGEDRKLGAAGIITPIADPAATASAVAQLLTDQKKWKKARAVAQTRVEKYYDELTLFESYRKVYQKALS
jgi:glycosyltransferase involved in cell wall biosynthesis